MIENRDKTLILHDYLGMYFDQSSPESLRNAHFDFVEHSNAMKTKGISISSYMGDFFFKKEIQRLLDYEKILHKDFDANLKGYTLSPK